MSCIFRRYSRRAIQFSAFVEKHEPLLREPPLHVDGEPREPGTSRLLIWFNTATLRKSIRQKNRCR